MFGVPKFYGVKGRALTPVALDITFVIDSSGSENDIFDFVRNAETAETLSLALRGQGIGTQGGLPNRFSLIAGQSVGGGFDVPMYEYRFSGNRWVSDDNGNAFVQWGAGTAAGSPLGFGTEDVTSHVHYVASNVATRDEKPVTNPNIETIIITSSTEQDEQGNFLQAGTVMAALNQNAPLRRVIALSDIGIEVEPVHSPGAQYSPFGVVFNDNANYFVVYLWNDSPPPGGVPGPITVPNVPAADVAFRLTGTAFFASPSDPVRLFTGAGQSVNTVKMAAANGSAFSNTGALYSLTQIRGVPYNRQIALDAFGQSLGEALGGLIFGVYNP